jgi:hypothetical protein
MADYAAGHADVSCNEWKMVRRTRRQRKDGLRWIPNDGTIGNDRVSVLIYVWAHFQWSDRL